MYFSKPFIDPTNDKRVWELGVTIFKSEDGGATFENMPNSPTYDVGLKTDHHTMWIDPRNSRHTLVGGDGGMHESWDLGLTYTRLNNIPIGQFYKIAVDDRDPYWIYGGLQDNHSWMGPSATRHWLGILNQDWKQIGFSDGTGQAVDKAGYRVIYTTSDGGNVQRFDPETGDRLDIKPQPPKGDSAYRWDWDAPLVASRHTAGTVYLGGNRLFISKDMGGTWTATTDLTRAVNRDTLTLMGVLDKDIKLSRNDGESSFSEITAIAESPIDPKVLWVGTDDGNVQVSTDGGANVARGERGASRRRRQRARTSAASSRRARRAARRTSRSTRIATATSRRTSCARPTSARRGRRSRTDCRRRVGAQHPGVSGKGEASSSPAPSAISSSATTAARTGPGSPPTCRRRATTTSSCIRARRISFSPRTAAASGFSTTRRRSPSGRRRSRRRGRTCSPSRARR